MRGSSKNRADKIRDVNEKVLFCYYEIGVGERDKCWCNRGKKVIISTFKGRGDSGICISYMDILLINHLKTSKGVKKYERGKYKKENWVIVGWGTAWLQASQWINNGSYLHFIELMWLL